MQKFEFYDDGNNALIKHNLEPKMLIQIILNRDDEDLEILEDCYEMFMFRGNEVIVKWLATEYKLAEVENFAHIRSILRRAWNWFRNQKRGYIPEFKQEPKQSPTETARYKIHFSEDSQRWELIDKMFGVSITWVEGRFNDTQAVIGEDVVKLNGPLNAAILMRQATDWLITYHREKL